MALENLISIEFTTEELTALDTHLDGIQQVLAGKMVNITPEQRQQYGSIGNQNKLIVDKAKNYMEQHPNWVPNFIDKTEFDKDYNARQQMEERTQRLQNLTQQLLDTKTLLDHDNYTNTLSFYRMIRYLAGENEPGSKTVYEDMKVLFARSGRPTSTDQQTDA
ncbi:hypothetical protein IMCC3317_23460 [Kordia antarctica]|uniref:Uncharacterized protein n=1 Tax=Kordia antarctica TaxID=1218801 RepID=A0A7L4ZK20_9FLAO|nr:hypothetical protein [Kordia antarctica]QHI36975.1 hypothetical protein IMCC3317_23460 [Kordia antarctica]